MSKRFNIIDVIGSLFCLGVVTFAILWWVHEIGNFLINN